MAATGCRGGAVGKQLLNSQRVGTHRLTRSRDDAAVVAAVAVHRIGGIRLRPLGAITAASSASVTPTGGAAVQIAKDRPVRSPSYRPIDIAMVARRLDAIYAPFTSGTMKRLHLMYKWLAGHATTNDSSGAGIATLPGASTQIILR